MNKLWIGFAAVIVFGSLYPFDFQARPLDSYVLSAFLETCCQRSSRGDILGNVVLFAPFGFLGVASAGARRSLSRRVWLVFLTGTALALLLQLAQIYLPSRDENLQDVGWNVIGLVGGAAFGLLSYKHLLASTARPRALALVPCLLIGSWLAYRLLPFVPSLDFQGIKDSLKPLFLYPEIQPVSLARDTVAWLVVASLLQRAQRGVSWDATLPILMLGTFGLEVLIVSNVVTASNLAGAVLALALWWGALRRVGWQAGGLAVLLCALLIVQGLAPFTLSARPQAFAWLPFRGLLGGSMYVNVQAICEKVFLYGSLIYLLWQTRFSPIAGVTMAVALVALVEFAQIYVAGHTPEITDPLLLVLAALTLTALRDQGGTDRQIEAIDPDSATVDQIGELVVRTINLRPDQSEFLADLSRHLNASVSEIGRRMIDQAIQEKRAIEPDSPIGQTSEISSESVTKDGEWVQQKLRLRQDQIDSLEGLSRERGVSFSNVTRGIIEQFIRQR